MVQTSRGAVARRHARDRSAVRRDPLRGAPRRPAALPRTRCRRRAWDGVREAGTLGRPLPQPERSLPGLFSEALLGSREDRDPELTLNVWTPDPGARGLPVLVWLHGGAFIAGSPRLYDGSAWMRDGVVLVTRRLPARRRGLRPLRAAATRTSRCATSSPRSNGSSEEIAAFGGDPGRVCLAGQSAGAMSLGWLLGSERSARALPAGDQHERRGRADLLARAGGPRRGDRRRARGRRADGRGDERGPGREGDRRPGSRSRPARSSSTPARTGTRPAACSGSRRSATAMSSRRTRSPRSVAARRSTC